MTKVREQINELFQQEMDRKRFLQYSAGVFLAAFGITGLINAILTNGRKPQIQQQPKTKTGYGSSRFGN